MRTIIQIHLPAEPGAQRLIRALSDTAALPSQRDPDTSIELCALVTGLLVIQHLLAQQKRTDAPCDITMAAIHRFLWDRDLCNENI